MNESFEGITDFSKELLVILAAIILYIICSTLSNFCDIYASNQKFSCEISDSPNHIMICKNKGE